jgi:lysophospholipase L1-like esterase
MRRIVGRFMILGLLVPALFLAQNPVGAPAGATPAGAQGAPRGGGARGPAAPANQPQARDDARHQGFVEIAKKGDIGLLFVGDSITDWFSNPRGGRGGAAPAPATGIEVWNANFGQYKPANFGIAGDTTQGVLWRMQNGELEGFKAKLIVLMLGTNNINRNPVDEIVDGDRLIIEEFKKRQPQAKVLLLGVFPRNADAANPLRATIKEINSKLAKLADNKQVFFTDIGDKFLTADGTLTTEVMGDGLHPTAKGYQIWADAISGQVKTLMQ